LRTSEDLDDPAVSLSYGPKAAQEVSGAHTHHEIGRVVRDRRKECGPSQRELGEIAGVSHTIVGRLESGKHMPAIDTLHRIAVALDLRFLIGFDDRAKGESPDTAL
jgi:transcriptional regulator with XRE-family HTH domain